MVACRACGTESPAGFRFCPACGSPLSDQQATQRTTPPAEERRVITVLFCDLVGFTTASEQADPEDVDAMLRSYAEMARAEVQRHGGAVEKFIGDAVVGIFGIPTAHEDDAERAVRAGLGITAGAVHLRGPDNGALKLRVGINTGEVLARLSVDPASGERLVAGDAVNTAARIQSAAPEMAVVVGPSTHHATRRRFDFEELPPASLKGKAEDVALFRVIGPTTPEATDEAHASAGTYVGREEELQTLIALFESLGGQTPARLVTVIGDAGMGKSRIVAELRAHAQAAQPNVTWLRGRCLPYGDGITFWALGEIVKAQAGILESDTPEAARDKLAAAVAPGPDAAWLLERLLPLVGVDTEASAAREELFSAWRRHLEALAAGGRAILVFEDLHWADAALLEFLEYVAVEATGGPLLLVGTARPDLFARHPGFATASPTVTRLDLIPLTAEQTRRLAANILGGALPDALAGAITTRAEGNPLYAEEYVRLLRDRGLLQETNGSISVREGAELPLPESIHALLAARLDTLPADSRSVLVDASVIGKVFWSGAVDAVREGTTGSSSAGLADLERRDFVRRVGLSSMAEEVEYAFSHVLMRDVAYNHLPRRVRAARHASAATWLEHKLGARVEDIADVLADHWHTALELATASGQNDRAAEFAPQTLRFLVLAGDRAVGLDSASALIHLERALTLAPPGHPMRPEVLLRFGDAAQQLTRFEEAERALEEAVASFAARGAWREAARARLVLATTLLGDGKWDRYEGVIPDAIAELEQHEPTPELVAALTELAIDVRDSGETERCLEILDRCFALADELGLPRPARALGFRGQARAALGDIGGFDDMRESVQLATAAGLGREVIVAKINLANWISQYQGPAAAIEPMGEAIEDAERRGVLELAFGMRGMLAQALFDAGEYDAAVAELDAREQRPSAQGSGSGSLRYRVRAIRGEIPPTRNELAGLEEDARSIPFTEKRIERLTGLAWLLAMLGHAERALALIREVAALMPETSGPQSVVNLPALVREACRAGEPQLGEAFMAHGDPGYPRATADFVAASAVRAELGAEPDLSEALRLYSDAAESLMRLTLPYEEAHARLGAARCLAAMGRAAEAAQPIAAARAIAERLGAVDLAAEAEAMTKVHSW